jgi:hypothetical protein
MRGFEWLGKALGRFGAAAWLPTGLIVWTLSPLPCPAADAPAVFPAAPYDGFIVYESLAVFWIALIGLIVIIRMKLREIERTQALGADREDDHAPLLQ